jgi:hypothetical protein
VIRSSDRAGGAAFARRGLASAAPGRGSLQGAAYAHGRRLGGQREEDRFGSKTHLVGAEIDKSNTLAGDSPSLCARAVRQVIRELQTDVQRLVTRST